MIVLNIYAIDDFDWLIAFNTVDVYKAKMICIGNKCGAWGNEINFFHGHNPFFWLQNYNGKKK